MFKKVLVTLLFIGLLMALIGVSKPILAAFATKAASVSNGPLTQGITQIGGVGGSIQDIASQDGFLYATLGTRLVVFDVQDPTQPIQVAQSSVMPARARGLYVAGDYAYVADGLGGLRIFDIHTATTPIPVGFYQTDGLAQNVKVAGNYAYVAKMAVLNGTNYEGGGLDIIDISDPTAPFFVGNLPVTGDNLWYQATIDVVENTAYLGEVRGYSDDGLLIVDVSNPAAPTQIGFFTFPTERGGVYDIAVRNGIAFVTSTYRLYALDVANPSVPAIVGEYGYPAYGGQLALLDDYAYVTDFNRSVGLHVVDVSDPTHLSLVTTLELGTGVSDVTAVNHTVYWAGTFYQSQIGVLDVTDPAQPVTTGTTNTPSLQDSSHLVVNGNYLYTSEYFGGGHVTDITNPAAASILHSMSYDFDDAAFAEGYGYWVTRTTLTSDAEAELQIFDMTNPQSPQQVGSLVLHTPWWAADGARLVVNYPYVYVGADALYVTDVSDPTQPLLITTVPSPQNIRYEDLTQEGQYLYLTSGPSLQILDMAAPDAPVEVSTTELLTFTGSIAALRVIGDYAYVGQRSEIAIIDVTNPLLPTLASSYVIGGFISRIEAVDDYLFIIHNQYDSYPDGDFIGGLQIFNVAQDPTAPVEVAFHRPMLYPRDIALDGNMIYTANGPEGVFAFRFTPPVATTVTAVSTATLNSPFDQTSYIFPAGTFSNTVTVTHTQKTTTDLPSFGSVAEIDHNFVVTAVYSDTAQPAEVSPGHTYTLTIQYSHAQIAGVIENSLTLYRWDGQAWQAEPDFVLDDLNNTLTATLDQPGQFAVLGETYRQFLPVIVHWLR